MKYGKYLIRESRKQIILSVIKEKCEVSVQEAFTEIRKLHLPRDLQLQHSSIKSFLVELEKEGIITSRKVPGSTPSKMPHKVWSLF